MEKKLARILSVVFHPLLVPSLFLIALYQTPVYLQMGIPVRIKNMVLLFVFIMTFVLPFLVAISMRMLKLLESLEMRRQSERMLPMVVITLFFYITFYSLKKLDIFQPAAIFMMGSTVLVLLGLIFNYFYKISQHMIGWGGFTGALLALSYLWRTPLYFWIFGIILVSGFTGYARLKAEAHTPFEVYSGWLLGCVVMGALYLM